MSVPNGNTSNIIRLEKRNTASTNNNDVVDQEEVDVNADYRQLFPDLYADADAGNDGDGAEAYEEEKSVPLRESDLVLASSHPVEGEEGYIPTDNNVDSYNGRGLNLDDYDAWQQRQENEGRIVPDCSKPMPIIKLRGFKTCLETQTGGFLCGGKNVKESRPLQQPQPVPGKKAVNKVMIPIPNKPKLEKGRMYDKGRASLSVSDDTDDHDDDDRCVPSPTPSHNYLSPVEKEKRKKIPYSETEKNAFVKDPAPTTLSSTDKKTIATSGNSVSSDEPCLLCQGHLLMGSNQVYVEAKWAQCKWEKINLDGVIPCLKRVHTSCRDTTTLGLRGKSAISASSDNDYLCPSHK